MATGICIISGDCDDDDNDADEDEEEAEDDGVQWRWWANEENADAEDP